MLLGRGLFVELLQDFARVYARELVKNGVQLLSIAHAEHEQVAGLGPHDRTEGPVALTQAAAGYAHVPSLQEDLGDQVSIIMELWTVS